MTAKAQECAKISSIVLKDGVNVEFDNRILHFPQTISKYPCYEERLVRSHKNRVEETIVSKHSVKYTLFFDGDQMKLLQ